MDNHKAARELECFAALLNAAAEALYSPEPNYAAAHELLELMVTVAPRLRDILDDITKELVSSPS